jgi:hypothetical protein
LTQARFPMGGVCLQHLGQKWVGVIGAAHSKENTSPSGVGIGD